MPTFVGSQAIKHSGICCFLQIHVQGRVDSQSIFVNQCAAIFLFQVLPDVLDKIRR